MFGTVDRIPLTGRDPDRIHVARAMMRAWAAFAHTGTPHEGEVDWKPWTRSDHRVHHFGNPVGSFTPPTDLDLRVPDHRRTRSMSP
ncbi:hypothetical protein ACFWPV_39060 [Streptomyces uncialis]|uniref:hypothetical protein n=1 Tax=Streptomyces uncialis TaxID=1048205 RepID=UPI003649A6BE